MTFPCWPKGWLFRMRFMISSALKPISELAQVVIPVNLPVIPFTISGIVLENFLNAIF